MNEPLFVSNTVIINAPAAKVWDALVNPEKTKIYMFGCEALSGWKPGDSLIWKGVFDGQELVAVKGHIVSIEPEKQLVYTTFDPNNPNMADVPENYLTVVYDLLEANGQTRLTASQGDFSTVANGQARYEEVYDGGQGWTPILVQVKDLVESELKTEAR
jgi:uncharacterized protein YndB with AHSA1/START domain